MRSKNLSLKRHRKAVVFGYSSQHFFNDYFSFTIKPADNGILGCANDVARLSQMSAVINMADNIVERLCNDYTTSAIIITQFQLKEVTLCRFSFARNNRT